MLERDYTYIAPHDAAPTAEGDPSTLRADSYQELVNALVYFVGTGAEEGTIRLYIDSERVETDLEAACLEVVQEDPLGAYAVEFIKYKVSPVVSYSQADVQITYRRTREQVASIVQATGVTAIRSELEASLSSFAQERVLRIGYFDGDEDYIRELAHQAYYAAPITALGMPELEIVIYPDSGLQRIVEILLEYPLPPEELEHRKAALAEWFEDMARPLGAPTSDERIQTAAQAVMASGAYDPSGGSTAYDLMADGSADSEGLALAFTALCQTLELPCQVARGTLDGEAHCWNVVRTSGGWRHLDLTIPAEADRTLYTDPDMTELGYSWDTDLLPPCYALQEAG